LTAFGTLAEDSRVASPFAGARAIALDPEILVFDEPSAGPDAIVAAELDVGL
jgi:ABC-type transporter Mla maintaining outer membrane lipid asymmetry ATPase subunit MlaF